MRGYGDTAALIGPTDETPMTPLASVGSLKQVALSIVRSCVAFGGKSGLVSSLVGCPRSVFLVAERRDERHAARARTKLARPLRRGAGAIM